ncbi:MAG TPA: AAA family ATPase, partial [Verrucomicrobiae bacterium]|nr:AAA family ATPase [Verrucomicrobiae bacterium]
IYGHPASGKTTTALLLAEKFGLPLLRKDRIKEIIFDHDLGPASTTSRASYEILYYFMSEMMKTRQPFIAEGNFMPVPDYPRLADLQKENGYKVLQIRCSAAPSVLTRRLVERAQTPSRHPGHRDLEQLQYLQDKYLNHPSPLLSAEWPLVELNTEQSSNQDIDRLLNQIAGILEHF